MKHFFLSLILGCAVASATAQSTYQVPVSEAHEQMQTGKYQPTWESLEKHQTPEWFRDAKFGIWAHWGPQCVEGSGDWMARSMYVDIDVNPTIEHGRIKSRNNCSCLRISQPCHWNKICSISQWRLKEIRILKLFSRNGTQSIIILPIHSYINIIVPWYKTFVPDRP